MTVIDRYLVQLYVKVVIVAFVSLMGLYVVIDGFNNLDEFLNYGNHRLSETLSVLVGYYAPRFLMFFDRTAGPIAMAAAAFVLTVISRSNELTALMAAGIGPARVVRPLIGASLVVFLLAIANREIGLPRVREALAHNAQDLRGDTTRKLTPRYDLRTDILISGQSTVALQKQIVAPNFPLPQELWPAWGRQISAESANHLPADANHPAGYLLHKVKQPAKHGELSSCRIGDQTILFSPADAPWLQADECFVASVVPFEQLSVGNAWLQNLSTAEVVGGLRGQMIEPGPAVWLTLHSRFVRPLLDLSLVLLGVPLVLFWGTRNIFMAAVIGICLAAVLVMVVVACDTLGKNYLLSATFAAWLPLLIFGPMAYTFARPLWD